MLRGLSRAYATQAQEADSHVGEILQKLDEVERELARRFSFVLEGKRVLDVGSGQRLAHLAYFARRNDATGIDLDVIPQGWDIRAYATMLQRNGIERTTKTIGRKLLRVDARFRRRYEKRIGPVPRLDVRAMDAAHLEFGDAAFDFVFAYSVFQHFPDPTAVVSEISRVIRPGGIFYASLHLYTSRNGSLDPRHSDELWPHLRGAPTTSPVYLNCLRLADWREVFGALEGSEVCCNQPDRATLEPEARRLELEQYELDELLTHNVTVYWRKPAPPQA